MRTLSIESIENPARIIVVEDNPADVALLRYALDQHGDAYELEVLIDGEQALRFVQQHRTGAREPRPCVIVLDLYLPRYDGLAVLKAIRDAPALAHIRVVVLSSTTTAEEEQRMLELGIRLYRNKPANLEDLTALGREILSICKEHAAPVDSGVSA
jgi:CheY-like chemotaxis protein